MRFRFLPVIAIATISLVGCGAPSMAPVAPTSGAMTASSEVPEGKLIFDKKITYKAVAVLGIGGTYAAKLEKAGVETVNQLLLAGAKPSDRARLARETGISEKLVLTWVNHADLMRVTGCGPEYARLLELAGVDTTVELAARNPIQLAAKLKLANDLGGGKRAVKRLPDIETTLRWIANAKTFVRVIKH